MSQTKIDRLYQFIREQTKIAVARYAADHPSVRDTTCQIREVIAIYVGSQIAEKYRMMELDDIMRWKFRGDQ